MNPKPSVLVIGSGLAGLFFALKAAEEFVVTIISKDGLDITATSYAQGGLAAALSPEDSEEIHMRDTIEAGAGLCDEEAVRILVSEGKQLVRELIEMGMPFHLSENGEPELSREGGHSRPRVLNALDQTGKMIQNYLSEKVRNHPNVSIYEWHMAVDLITEHHMGEVRFGTTCMGAYVLEQKSGEIKTFLADYTMIAAGGGGHLYPVTTNPQVATGDGVAIAFRAGCRVRNMEFYQFHPTAFVPATEPPLLITEAIRGHGAKLVDSNGNRFMVGVHPMAELAPRDIVARTIDKVLKATGAVRVYLDLRHLDAAETKVKFPHIYETLKKGYQIDITQDLIPITPAAHYMCGGIIVDAWSRTDLEGLYASGESASNGVHGANRLASNSLLEALVFSHRAYLDIKAKSGEGEYQSRRSMHAAIPPWNKGGAENASEWVLVHHDLKEIQQIMWDYVGILRTRFRLERAKRRIELLYQEIDDFYQRTVLNREILEMRNLVILARITVFSALSRRESRGLHFMQEYPENRTPSRRDTVIDPAFLC